MIVDAQAADGEVIWEPDLERGAGDRHRAIRRLPGRRRASRSVRAMTSSGSGRWMSRSSSGSSLPEFAGVEFGGAAGPVCTTDAMPHTRWFPGRTLNFARHLLQGHEGTALIGIAEDGTREEVTWDALRREVASLAAHLRARGVGHGDRVVAILPNVAEAVVGLLATASIGAVWSVCAPEFGPGAIVSRFAQLGPEGRHRRAGLQARREGPGPPAKSWRRSSPSSPPLEHVIWVGRHTVRPEIPTPVPAVDWAQAVAEPAELVFDDVEFSHPLWVLFSSGTTGIPKGIVHGHGGALLEEMKMLLIHSDLRPGDRYLNVASTSWVLWNALVSALGVGATAVLVDGNPTFPSHRPGVADCRSRAGRGPRCGCGICPFLREGRPGADARPRPGRPEIPSGHRIAALGRRLSLGLRQCG